MKLDHKKWRDSVTPNLTDSNGLMTDYAKQLCVEHGATSLDDLLWLIESKGKGFWYKNDTNRPDVGSRGHYSDSLAGKFSVEVDDWNAKGGTLRRAGEGYVSDVYENVENMYYVNGKWTTGRTIKG